jgi:hypothetical protein
MDLSIKIIGAVAIPLTVISLILNVNQFNTQQQQAQAQALDQQQQTTLQNYLGTMSDLLLKENLRGSK